MFEKLVLVELIMYLVKTYCHELFHILITGNLNVNLFKIYFFVNFKYSRNTTYPDNIVLWWQL